MHFILFLFGPSLSHVIVIYHDHAICFVPDLMPCIALARKYTVTAIPEARVTVREMQPQVVSDDLRSNFEKHVCCYCNCKGINTFPVML
jgi:hypothetical protein